MEYGFGYIILRSPYTPYSLYLRGTIGFRSLAKTGIIEFRVLGFVSFQGNRGDIHRYSPIYGSLHGGPGRLNKYANAEDNWAYYADNKGYRHTCQAHLTLRVQDV